MTLNATPHATTTDVDSELGVYAQDRWTLKRLTLTLGVRYDHFADSFPEQSVGPALLAPNRNITFPAQKNVAWDDITPKSAAAYDLFGNGSTAVKVTLNKYLQGMLSGVASTPNPVSTLVNSTARAWTDANRNYVPDCDLTNPAAQDNRAGGGDFCAQMADANFGKRGAGLDLRSRRCAAGASATNWEFSAGVQQKDRGARLAGHQLLPAVAWQLHGHRQPDARAGRLRRVQHHRAGGSATSDGGGWHDRRATTSSRRDSPAGAEYT